ncbi:MAG: hypothetical protein PWQ49_262 [Methanohalophilus sp.]|nr:hypothetical protein [Methanohalophilus sp.]
MSIIFLILLSTGMVSAEKIETHTMAEDKLELANELYGINITYGEYIKQLFPEEYDESPDPSKARFYSTKISWPDESKEFDKTNGAMEASSTSEDQKLSVPIPYLIHGESEIDVSNSNIDYKSWQRMVLPTPYTRVAYMEVVTNLQRNDGDHVTIVGVKRKTGYNVYKLEASGSYTASTSGYYKAVGLHYVEWPASPGYYAGSSFTDWTYVN